MRDVEDAQHAEDEGDAGRDEKQPRRERKAVDQDDRQDIHENRTLAPLRAEWNTARSSATRAHRLDWSARTQRPASALLPSDGTRPGALTLFPGRPAFDPVDRLPALRRNDIGGGENAELIEDRIAELGVLLAGGETPHCRVHCLMILAHENAAARCVKLESFHRGGDLLIGRPSPGLRLDGFFDRSLQPIEGDRKSTRLNSSHEWISYAVFCLKKKKK